MIRPPGPGLTLALSLGLLLTACAVRLPPRDGELRDGELRQAEPLLARFGALATLDGQSLPLQGEWLWKHGQGSLVLVLPHGRALGQCRYASGAGGNTTMTCALAAGMDPGLRGLVRRMGMALYRASQALPRASGAPPAMATGADWSVRFRKGEDGWEGDYTEGDRGMRITLYLTEVARP